MRTLEQMKKEKASYQVGLERFESNLEKMINKGKENETAYGQKLVTGLRTLALKVMDETDLQRQAIYKDIILPALLLIEEQKAHNKKERKEGNLQALVEVEQDPFLTIAHNLSIIITRSLSTPTELTFLVSKMVEAICFYARIPNDDNNESVKKYGGFFIKLVHEVEAKSDVFNVTTGIDKSTKIVEISISCRMVVDNNIERMSVNTAIFKPMIIKPLPHKDLISGKGGYLSIHSPLIKYPEAGLEEFTDVTNPEWFEEINNYQEVGYVTNDKLLKILTTWFSEGKMIGDVRLGIEDIEKEANILAKEETEVRNTSRKVFAKSNNTEYTPLLESTTKAMFVNNKKALLSKRSRVLNLFSQAQEFSGIPFYFPVFLDFRGRRYAYLTEGLNYQGTELEKASLQFADKQPLDQEGFVAMFEVLGNALGGDKMKRADKAVWASQWWEDNKLPMIDGCFDLLRTQEGMDEPITALAICIELAEWEKDRSYKTGYIAHQDARCSGIQIQGALQQDRTASYLCSLMEDGKDVLPDPYVGAATFGKSLMERRAGTGDEVAASLIKDEQVSDLLFSRKMFKMPTMTRTSYGSTGYGVRKENKEMLNQSSVLRELTKEQTASFNQVMMEALDGNILSCSSFLHYSLSVCKVAAEEQGIISYNAPLTGFPVKYKTFKEKKTFINAYVDGKRTRSVIYQASDKINTRKMATSSAPNIIHSIDAAMISHVGMKMEGKPLSTIHDSIGSHPNHCHLVLDYYNDSLYQLTKDKQLDKLFSQIAGKEVVAPFQGTMTKKEVKNIKQATHSLT